MKGGEHFVKPVALFVERLGLVGQRLRKRRIRIHALCGKQMPFFQPVQGFANIAAGMPGKRAQAGMAMQGCCAQYIQRFFQTFDHIVAVNSLQLQDAQARQQGVIDMERGVFRGRANQRNRAVLDERQKGILLCLVEAVDFINEQDGAPPDCAAVLRLRHRFAHFFHTGKHRRQTHEIRIESARQQQRQRGFAAARRPPEQHGERLVLGDGCGQGGIRAQDVALANIIGEGLRAHTLGQRLIVTGKKTFLLHNNCLNSYFLP